MSIIRCLTSSALDRCNIAADCCSTDLTGTKRIVGRITASQIASTSAGSFFYRLT